MKFASFTLLLVMTLFFLVSGCKAPPSPSGRNINRGGPPDETKSLLVVCPSIKKVKGMIFDKTMNADTFTIRGMKCRIELTRNETEFVAVVVRKEDNNIFLGTVFQPRNNPDSYQTVYKITFSYPGFKDVVFTGVPIMTGRIEVPEVVFQGKK